MSRVERFEDLIALQKARVLAGEIYRSTRTSDFSRDFGLVNQIRRAAVCVLGNLAQGSSSAGGAQGGRPFDFRQVRRAAENSSPDRARSQVSGFEDLTRYRFAK